MIFLENEILYGQSFPVPKLDDFVLPIGKARIARDGKDVTIVSFSMGMSYALKAAEELAKEGIEAEVIDLRTLRPMDTDTIIASVKKTGRIVTVEEGWPQAGIGAEIAARVIEHAFDYLDAPVTRCPARMCRCPTPPIWKSLRCRPSPRWSRRRKRSATGSGPWPTATTIRGFTRRWRCPSRRSRTAGWKSCASASSTTSFMSRRCRPSRRPPNGARCWPRWQTGLGAIYAAQKSGLSKKDVAVQIAEAFAAEMGARPVKASKAKPARGAKKPSRKKR